jgi:hypothetical protein
MTAAADSLVSTQFCLLKSDFTYVHLVHNHTANFHCPTSRTNHVSCVVHGRTYREENMIIFNECCT